MPQNKRFVHVGYTAVSPRGPARRCVTVWQCYDTEAYSAERRTLDFHHVRTVTLSGGSLDIPAAMVGHSAARRLFILEHASRIKRIDPVSGEIDLDWSVNEQAIALKVASNDHLLLTSNDRIDEFDTDGNLIRVIPAEASPINKRFWHLMSLLLQDSMYFHSAFHNLLSANHRQVLAIEITQIPIFAFDVAAYITAGRPTCNYF